MGRICSPIPIRYVAAITVRRRLSRAGMAEVAINGCVKARQREDRLAVVKRCTRPRRCCVTGSARCRESDGDVIRYCPANSRRESPVGNVAGVTVARRRSCTGMAEVACHCDVRAGQREWRRAVVEACRHPVCCRMADRAVRRISGSRMIGNRSAGRCGRRPIGQVAAVAGRRVKRVVVADVAGGTRRRHRGDMHPRKSEAHRAVVERGRRPVRCRMARRAVGCGESCPRCLVWRRIRLLPRGQVASRVPAIGRGNH
jgi:hypothetical protein